MSVTIKGKGAQKMDEFTWFCEQTRLVLHKIQGLTTCTILHIGM